MASGLNSAINASLSSMYQSSQKTSIVSGNIANTETNAFKMTEMYGESVVTPGSGVASGVSANIYQLVDMQGDLSTTSIGTDLAIEGAGFAVVTDSFVNGVANNVYVTRDLSFRKDKTDNLVNTSGYYLLAWPVDASGNLPSTKSLLSSLQGVNVTQWTSNASATTEIKFGANLVSQERIVGDAIANIGITNRGTKASPWNAYIQPTDILWPNPVNSLTQGEGLEITIGNPALGGGQVTKKVLYDGFANTFSFTNSANSLCAGVGGQLATDTFTILYGDQTLSVTRGTGATNLAVLENIMQQINNNTPSTNGLQAKLFDFGTTCTLYIAPTDINSSVTFSGLLSFRNQLGLNDSKNIPAFVQDSEGVTIGRFATLQQLSNILTNQGLTSSVTYDAGVGTNISIKSKYPVAFNNYQPLGKNSDFLTEFGLNSGYLQSGYDPYVSTKNMAGGNFNAHFSQNITIYDSMGNQSNLMFAFLKTGVNQWNVEVYSTNPLSVVIPGRTDGLLMAGVMKFDGSGNFQSITNPVQYAYSNDISTPNDPLGATIGQTFPITVGSSSYNYVYGPMSATSNFVSESGTGFTGTATDTLNIVCGATTYNIARGAGTTNYEVMLNMAQQINATSGADAIHAEIVFDSLTLTHAIRIWPVDTSLGLAFSQTGTVGTNLNILAANNVAPNSFQTLYDLAAQINTTQGPMAVHADIVPGDTNGSYKIRVQPVNGNYYLSFSGGTNALISSPLGTGVSQTIADAMGISDTTSASQLKGINETLNINWSNIIGANPNSITLSWGTFGLTDGMGQVSGNYTIKDASQNGVSTGDLTGIAIDERGVITASFSNSLTREIYKIPMGLFANPNGLMALAGNVFQISKDSGPMTLSEATINGAGQFSAGTLEGSNVDIASELAKLIFAQRQYQASSRVISVVDKLLDDLVNRTFN